MTKQTITKALLIGAFLVLVIGVLQFYGCSDAILPGVPDGGDKVEVSAIPDDWEEHVTEQGFTFRYPKEWVVVEHQKFGVLISDQDIDTRHEMLDVPIVITVREQSLDEIESTLSESNPSSEKVKYQSLKGKRFKYNTEPGPRTLYALTLDDRTLKVGVADGTLPEGDIEILLNSITVVK